MINMIREYNQITNILSNLDRKKALQILGEILHREYDLITASKMVKEDCDSTLNKLMFEDMFFSEGNEESGFIELKTILNAVEEIVNCDDYLSGEIKFTNFVRPETEEEMKDNCRDSGIDWWIKDDSIDIKKLYLGFEG